MRRSLVVMSPESLLRHPLAVSSLEELMDGIFLSAIGETDELDPKGVKHVVMYSGKVCHGLLGQRRKNNQHDAVIVRIGQFYPSPRRVTQEVLQQFAHVKDFVQCQEESLNQGVWYHSQHRFREVILLRTSLRCTGHSASASPAIEYMSVHQKQ